MSHFYGIIQGNRGEVSRGGSKDSGFYGVVASWEGCIRVTAYHDKNTGKDMVRITKDYWHGAGEQKTLYEGKIGK